MPHEREVAALPAVAGNRSAPAEARDAVANAEGRDGCRLAANTRQEPLFVAAETASTIVHRRVAPFRRHLEPVGHRAQIVLEVLGCYPFDGDVSRRRRQLARRHAVQDCLLEVELRKAGHRECRANRTRKAGGCQVELRLEPVGRVKRENVIESRQIVGAKAEHLVRRPTAFRLGGNRATEPHDDDGSRTRRTDGDDRLGRHQPLDASRELRREQRNVLFHDSIGDQHVRQDRCVTVVAPSSAPPRPT